MTSRFKEVIDWSLILLLLGWGIWFLKEGHYFSTLIVWVGALIILPYLNTFLRKQWDFKFYEQFKWPILVVLLSLLILSTQIGLEEVAPEIIVIEKEIFAPEIQQPAEIIEEVVVGSNLAYILMTSEGFQPQELAVVSGTTVIWNNTWSVHVLHIYQLDGKYKNVAQSKKLPEGELFTHTFTEPGIYYYRDLYFGWKGKVHVS